MSTTSNPVAVVTGASSGIGAATARALAGVGYDVVLGARRLDRLEEVAAECGGTAIELDVTEDDSVAAFAAAVDEKFGRCDVLVNNAGGALGTESVAEANIDDWRWMYEVNVLGTLRVTKALLPALVASGDGQVISIGSIAAREPYKGGAGYNAAKHGVAALSRVLRIELLGQPVRVCEIDPGMVHTDFSLVRFKGDQEKADAVYRGVTPLTAEDVADTVSWVATRPAHVNIDQILMLARDQTSAQVVHRTEQ
ncbi:NADP-dependent 3-hydroxy acid dehydrogenase YdfG [Sediminihabitans luteus]|uniref:NADP-dependent 3-hydroxy acid dehydrogenase YdfG n=1 Tax=Sediminihabitans luteus TaxID=1138585 RepID=A0A2M9D0X7_9CELL|nr:SDR family NAD(P)-dependent oxidoreductase [Sediminihabitans luteus]PJJ77842.1 NADP-dependent 3-hydroxy acid dehydrogenase YdfG [Sediminihabitans luteus]GII99800.1 putative short chain dehydrogenase/reductase [Sediminihabitans luteus]